jgi:outer membrane protein assembly factor BamB
VCAAALLVPRPSSADTCVGLALGSPASGTTADGPSAVAVGDFNRDGKPDVATANSAVADTISVLLGTGSGGLGMATSWPSTSSPTDIVAGDLDRDGRLDLVVASGTVAEVAAHRGLAGGAFAAFVASNMTVLVVPARLALGDFDRDGFLDLVVVSETGQRVRVLRGDGTMDFDTAAVLADLSFLARAPSAATTGDFDHDGDLDLAVAARAADQVEVFLNDGGGTLTTGPTVTVGDAPGDVFAGDIDGDGWLDLVTANGGTPANASVLLGDGTGDFAAQTAVDVGGQPTRVALADLDRDGSPDLVALDAAAPRLVAFEGGGTSPDIFGTAPFAAALAAAPRGLALGDFTSDARADLVTVLPAANEAVVVPNDSGSPCARTSFALAPRSYLVPDGPVSTAAADFNHDGRVDLAVATFNDRMIRVRKGVPGGFATLVDLGPFTEPPRAVATTDLDFDGNADIVAALGSGSGGSVFVFFGDGAGGFFIAPSLAAGTNTSAVAIGDFDGNGAPDVAATAEGPLAGNRGLWVFLSDGQRGFTPFSGNPLLPGLIAPRALVAADLTGDGLADLAVAEHGTIPLPGTTVHVLRSDLDEPTPGFAPIASLTVGNNPAGVAAADVDSDGQLDLVTADYGSSRVSVIRRSVGGGFLASEPHTVGSNPTAVAVVELTGDLRPDIAVTTAGNRTLTILGNGGAGVFSNAGNHAVRDFPQTVTPVDADADGRLDLAVTCQSADAVVVLLSRPPSLEYAPWVAVAAGSQPRAAVAADLDGDGDLDLAVANAVSGTMSFLRNDGAGGYTLHQTLAVGAGPDSIAAADFNRDGRVDLALNAPSATPTRGVSILLAKPAPEPRGEFENAVVVAVGSTPDALAVGDFNRDGIPDLAVCDKVSSPGYVRILLGDGSGGFPGGSSVTVADQPTSIVAADFDRDGDLDLAVGYDLADNNLQILTNTSGSFSVVQTLDVPDTARKPLSLAVGDFDDSDTDDAVDLAAMSFGDDRLHVYQNLGTGTFATTPSSLNAPSLLQAVTAADVNLDGRPDLLAVATGLTVFRGSGGMGFEAPETLVAGWLPVAVVVGDFNGDGRPDAAVVNQDSGTVSILRSTACQGRRLEVSVHPVACDTGPLPYGPDAEVRIYDEGGNPATCTAGMVVPSIAPGTGDPLAQLGGSGVPFGLPLADGVVSFTGLTIDRPGRRYRLQFALSGLPPVQTRSFTLGPELQILGTPSICPLGSATFTTEGSYDEYSWTLSPAAVPPAYTPTVTLFNPPVTSPPTYTLSVAARVDGCFDQKAVQIYGGALSSTGLAIDGSPTVCVDCIGPTIRPLDVGGGPPLSRQWGYREVAGVDPVIDMPGETGETYVLKGASFPGPGTYHVVVRTTPTCGTPGTISEELEVTVLSGVPTGEVLHLAASSRGTTSAGGQNLIQWVNATASAEEVRVRWNKAPAPNTPCLPPASILAPFHGQQSVTTPPPLPTVSSWLHDFDGTPPGLDFDTAYCYSVFVRVGATWSPGRTVKARPFNSDPPNPVKWAYSTGGTAVVPPAVGLDAVLAMSNDQTAHALTRGGASGGFWPPLTWVPSPISGVAHSRSPVVPFVLTSPVHAGKSVLFVGDDLGDVHAIDTKTGQSVWGGPSSQGKPVVGAPGGLFTQFGGVADLIVVGTRDTSGPNELRGLRVSDGSLVGAPFDAGGKIGAISGSPAIDYGSQKVYFVSRSLGGSNPTVWCVLVDGTTPFVPCPGFTNRTLDQVNGSPVLRNGRLYFGTEDGTVYSLDATTGGGDRTFSTGGDGQVKGFVFPNRSNDDLIFATDTKVWSISDTGAATMAENWQWTTAELTPSVVLYRPQTSYVYVGSRDGKLYELDFTYPPGAPGFSEVITLGDGRGQVGAPSLDVGVAPPDVSPDKKLLIVGSESGVLYGVEVPF